MSGVVSDVEGLPEGYQYEVIDEDMKDDIEALDRFLEKTALPQ